MKAVLKLLLLEFWSHVFRDAAPKVVFYHDIGTANTPMGTPRELFWAHMRYLRPLDRVCFDDGFRGIWDEREKFAGAGVKPLVFIAGRLIGQPGYLTWPEILELQNAYGFEFQCHTWSHQTLCGGYIDESPVEPRTEGWYRRELIESKVELERRLGRSVSALCFPAGLFSDDVVRRCHAAGYERLYASYPGNAEDDGSAIIPRNLVQDLGVRGFRAALRGGLMIFAKRYKSRHFVIGGE